jgi:hypothetical protein
MANSRDSLPSVGRFSKPLWQNGTLSLFDVVSCHFVFPFLLFFGSFSLLYFVELASIMAESSLPVHWKTYGIDLHPLPVADEVSRDAMVAVHYMLLLKVSEHVYHCCSTAPQSLFCFSEIFGVFFVFSQFTDILCDLKVSNCQVISPFYSG